MRIGIFITITKTLARVGNTAHTTNYTVLFLINKNEKI